ncbi:hypothetical protein H0H10_06465 [Streptomyces sp. TRM S81-3]|uniref:Secreted protein n=1 Tax=Streptomyces griseicoloratus TaxID=2752516 RepID=A0A926QP06_9ACTN|nr:hypothetical protein [Streptomyces griseicoloratus]
MMSRSSVITAGVAAAAALTATGITYATAAPEPQAAPAVVKQVPVQAPMGGDTGNNNDDDDNGKDKDKGKDHRGGDRGDREHGWIHINERSYSAHTSGCVVVASGLGSRSLNVRNDSKKTIEVFRGLTCDNGAPIATVGPHSSNHGVSPGNVDGVFVKDGVVGSFRVIDHGDHGNGKGDR